MIDIKKIKLKNEQDIISSWNDKEKIMVTVVCAAFNQELYIEDAIISFLMQDTNFAFEIIIHDDASIDKTADIIRGYQNKYPNIIKPIFQEENQYSKGGFKPSAYVAPFAKGEYIALCEGDDYWIDSNKLSKQLNVMQRDVNCKICFHPSIALYSDGQTKVISYHQSNECKFNLKTIFLSGGGFCPTASLFIETKVLLNMPEWFYTKAPFGDFYIQVIAASKGGYALYMPDKMSVYRKNSLGSWSESQNNNVNLIYKEMARTLEADIELAKYLKLNKYLQMRRALYVKFQRSKSLIIKRKLLDAIKIFMV